MRLLLANLAGASLASPPAQWLLPQPPALPWEPDNFLFLSGIEGEDHPFLTANAENSRFLFLRLTTEYAGPCLQLCNENHIILSPVVGGLWEKSCEAECVRPSVRKHFLPLPSDPSVLGPPSVLGDVKGPLREHCQESALLPCLQTIGVLLLRPWYKVIALTQGSPWWWQSGIMWRA